MPADSLDQIVSLCKRRGFIFPGSEIYGGLANTWDYGPLGVELKNRLKRAWWNHFVHKRGDMVGQDASILMNPTVWEASGHVDSFADPLIECKKCHDRVRGDKVIEEKMGVAYPEVTAALSKIFHESDQYKNGGPSALVNLYKMYLKDRENFSTNALPVLMSSDLMAISNVLKGEGLKLKDVDRYESYKCEQCGECDWTEPKQFNLMFKTQQGVIEGEGADVYLRPETAQGIFVNFKNVYQSMRMRLPFGIAQIGKAFRNEITPGNFTFRTREFEQMEIEYFFDPEAGDWKKMYKEWKEWSTAFVEDVLGISKENLRLRAHEADELSHYSKGTTDIEYKFPFGWGELCAAVAYRTDYDLSQHEKFSKQDLHYTDPDDPQRKFIPHVMEPSFGSDRLALAMLIDAYTEETLENGESRTVMKFAKGMSPYDCAVLPLSKKDVLINKAKEIYEMLLDQTDMNVEFDVTGSIGKRYRRQDEIGTPTCITVDFGTIGEDKEQCKKDHVTVRDRDSLKQEEVAIAKLVEALQS